MKPILDPKEIRTKVVSLIADKLRKDVAAVNDLIKELTSYLVAEENPHSSIILSNAITDATAQIAHSKNLMPIAW
jgi:hypothetical protein